MCTPHERQAFREAFGMDRGPAPPPHKRPRYFVALPLLLTLAMCGSGGNGGGGKPREEEMRKLLLRQRKALNARIEEERSRRGPGRSNGERRSGWFSALRPALRRIA